MRKILGWFGVEPLLPKIERYSVDIVACMDRMFEKALRERITL